MKRIRPPVFSPRFRCASLLAVGFLLAGAPLAPSATLYVATNATPASPYDTWNKAFTHLADALAAAGDGDTLVIAGHRFELDAPLSWSGSADITIRGGYAATNAAEQPGPRDPTLWPTLITRPPAISNRLLSATAVTNGTLDGLTFAGGDARGNGGGLLLNACPNFQILSCTIVSNTARTNAATGSISGGGLFLTGTTEATLSNCLLAANSVITERYVDARGGGIAIDSAAQATLLDCLLSRNSAFNPSISANNKAMGGAIHNAGTTRIVNGLVVKNEARHNTTTADFERGDGVYAAGGALTLVHCTLAHNLGQAAYRAGGTLDLTNCIVWSQPASLVGTVSNRYSNIEHLAPAGDNLSAHPQFEFGYYLATNSPCVDAGTPVGAGLSGQHTTRSDGAADAGAPDLGFHYREAFDRTWEHLYVSPGGDNASNGLSWAAAKRSVSAAAALARNGSHIHIAAGVYSNDVETFPLLFSDLNQITLSGDGAETTLLNANRSHRVLQFVATPDFRVEQLTLLNGYVAGSGAGLSVTAVWASNQMHHCRILTNETTGSGRMGGGVYVGRDSALVISNTLLQRNYAGSDYGSGGGGLAVDRSGRLAAFSLLILTNRGYSSHSGVYGGGLWNDGGEVQLFNCVFAGNWLKYASGNDPYENGDAIYVAGNTTLENCTVVNNANKGIIRNSGLLLIRNSIVWNNLNDVMGTATLEYSNIGSGAVAGVNGNISTNPLFINPAAYDFRLQSAYGRDDGLGGWIKDPQSSPCLDAGSNSAWMATASDILGLARLSVGIPGNLPARVDMGAHESPRPPNAQGTIMTIF